MKMCIPSLFLFLLVPLQPASAETHAVVIGIDQYKFVNSLRGAEADAKDIAAALGRRGLPVTPILNGEATRDRVLGEIDRVIAKARSGDLVIISFAGHGTLETWGKVHPPGVKEGDTRTAFVLANALPPTSRGIVETRPGGSAGERILGLEINARLKAIQAKGARTLFIADTCHGGGLTRGVLPESGVPETTYRYIPPFRFAEGADPLAQTLAKLPAAVPLETTAPDLTFLAAVDNRHRAPEVPIVIDNKPAVLRGALSYAVARAIDGQLKTEAPGIINRGDLVDFIKATVRTHAQNRQDPDITPMGGYDSVIIDFNRDLKVVPAPAAVPAPAPDASLASPIQSAPPAAAPTALVAPPEPAVPRASVPNRVRIWADALPISPAHGRTGTLDIEPAASRADADLSFDATSQKVYSSAGDLVAENIRLADLPSVAEREVARRRLLALAEPRPRDLRLAGGDGRYECLNQFQLDAGKRDASGSDYFVLFNIAGNSTVQFLYPNPKYNDPKLLPATKLFDPIEAQPPFGADTLVLVTSAEPLDTLIEALLRLDHQPKALDAVDIVERAITPDMRIGLQGIYTIPGTNTSPKCKT